MVGHWSFNPAAGGQFPPTAMFGLALVLSCPYNYWIIDSAKKTSDFYQQDGRHSSWERYGGL